MKVRNRFRVREKVGTRSTHLTNILSAYCVPGTVLEAGMEK